MKNKSSSVQLPRVAASPAAAGFAPAAAALAVACAFGGGNAAQAQPAGAQAIHGGASLQHNGNQLIVTTTNGAGTSHSAINWQSFSIPAGSSTYFQQPSAGSTSINRVVGPDPSAIFGHLGSNGRLVLVNPAGIAVGAGAVVDTAGFTASTLRMGEADAVAGRLRFDGGSHALTVGGSIVARSGDVVLIAPQVSTGAQALVQSPQGATILAAGQKVELTGRGLEGIRMEVQAPQHEAVNLGTLSGDAVGIFAGTLRHSGLVQATAVTAEGGKVVLKAQEQAEIAGRITAQAGDKGGQVHATASKVRLRSGAVIDASGTAGGGEVLLGGGWQGGDARIANAQDTVAESGSTIRANATGHGDGGTVVLWSDGSTRFDGRIEAVGGATGGDGGRIETSGKGSLSVGQAQVDARAPHGKAGQWLLDPTNFTIAGGSGAAADTIYETTIESAGADVLVTATDSIVASGAFTGGLTLPSGRSITISTTGTTGSGINLTGLDISTSGGGAITMTTAGSSQNIVTGNLSTGSGSGVSLNSAGGIDTGNISTSAGTGPAINLTAAGLATFGNLTSAGTIYGPVTVSGGAGIVQKTGTTIWANTVSLTATGGIANASGNLRVDAGGLTATNNGTGNIAIESISSSGLTVQGAGVTQNATGAGVALTSTNGLLTVAAPITASGGAIDVVADRLALNAAVNSGGATSGTVTLRPWTNATNVNLGLVGDAAGSLNLTQTELAQVTAGILKIGAAGYTGGITISDNITIAAGQVDQISLINQGAIAHSAGQSFNANKLNLDSATSVDLAGTVNVLAGKFGAGGFNFDATGNMQVGSVDIINGITAFGTTGGVSLTATGSLGVTQNVQSGSTGGNITLQGNGVTVNSGVTVNAPNGAATLNGTSNANDITLTGSTVQAGGGSVTLTNAHHVAVGNVTTGVGSSLVFSGVDGNISQAAGAAISANTITVGGSVTGLSLIGASNAFTTFQGVTSTGAVSVRNTGNLSLTGAISAGANAVDIRTTGGSMSVPVAVSGSSILLSATAMTVGNSLTASAGGITLQATAGNLTFNTAAPAPMVISGTSAFNFTASGAVRFSGGTAQINQSLTSTSLLDVQAGGTLGIGAALTIPNLRISGGTVTNAGAPPDNLTVSNSFQWTGGSLLGNSPVTLAGTSSVTGVGTLGRGLVNTGTLTLSGAGNINQTGGYALTNSGTLNLQTATPGITGSTTTFTNSGTVNVTGTGAQIAAGAINNASAGVITGNGTLVLSGGSGTLNNSGSIAPGGSGTIGTLTLNGNLNQLATGSLHVDIGTSTVDLLSVTGMSSFTAGSSVVVNQLATPNVGTYTIVSGTTSGPVPSLSGAPLGASLQQLASLQLVVAAAPPPPAPAPPPPAPPPPAPAPPAEPPPAPPPPPPAPPPPSPAPPPPAPVPAPPAPPPPAPAPTPAPPPPPASQTREPENQVVAFLQNPDAVPVPDNRNRRPGDPDIVVTGVQCTPAR